MGSPSSLRDADAIVIGQPWGGLGDNLQFSTLPERFARLGLKTWIAADNAVRNPEIFELVWGANPHVAGVIDRPANAGACRGPVYDAGLPKLTDFIQRIEIAHDLEPENRWPKVYHPLRPRPELAGSVLVDVGSVTQAYPAPMLSQYLTMVMQWCRYPREIVRQVRFTGSARGADGAAIEGIEPIEIGGLADYCDALAACRAFVTVLSGAQSLAVAVRGDRPTPMIHCLCTPLQFNWRNFVYEGVEYRVL